MKKALIFLSLLLVTVTSVIALSSCGMLLKRAGLYDGYEYNVDSEYEITLTGYKGESTKLDIPSWIDGYKVVGIAFNKNDTSLSKIESIKIPKTIQSIGPETFLPCTSLKEITVSLDNPVYKYYHDALYTKDGKTLICYPQGKADEELVLPIRVNKISDRALMGATKLKSVTMTGVIDVGSFAFIGCTSLRTVDFGKKIQTIGDGAFENCSSLTSLVIPDTAESIGESAFKGCTSLTELKVGSSVSYVGSYAFGEIDKLTNIIEYEGAYYLGGDINPYVVFVKVKEKNQTEYVIHSDTSVIYESAFEECRNLKEINIPNSLSCIGNRAFYNCKSLSGVVIPEAVHKIDEYAFYGCSSIKGMDIPSSVSEIGNSAFAGCTQLASVIFSDRTKSVGHMAFFECSALTSVTLPESVSYIGNSVFEGCSRLESITIPSGVEFIGEAVVERCLALEYNEYDNAYYLGNSENPYVALVRAKENQITACEINAGTKFILNSAFYACNKLSSIELPGSIVHIGPSAFEHCTALSAISIPKNVVYIGETAFAGCSYLASAVFEDANNWITVDDVFDPASLSDDKAAALILKEQDKSMTKINPDA